MNSVPTDGYTLPNDTNHTSLPFTPRLLETQDNEASTFLNGFSNDLLAFGDFNVDADVVSTPHHSTLPRHVNPLVCRRLFNIRRRRHILQGTIPQGSPSQPAFGGPLPANIFATVAPHQTIDPLGAYTLDTHPSSSLSDGLSSPGDFNVDADVVFTPHHSTLPQHVNPLVCRHLFNIIPQGSPSQPAFGGPPPANILATVTPHLPIDPLGAYTLDTHPSSLLSDGLSSPMFDNGSHVGAGVLTPQSADFGGFPHSNTHPPAIAPQLAVDVFDGRSDPITHPWASCPSSSRSAAFDSGEQLSLSGIQNIPMMPVMAPALAPSSSLTWMTSVSPTPEPLVRPWDASATLMNPAASASASTSMRAEPREPRRGPVSRCSCCNRFQPLVRVDDAIEWVRPDVMKMTLWFNWSPNADAEAQESWEPRGA